MALLARAIGAGFTRVVYSNISHCERNISRSAKPGPTVASYLSTIAYMSDVSICTRAHIDRYITGAPPVDAHTVLEVQATLYAQDQVSL